MGESTCCICACTYRSVLASLLPLSANFLPKCFTTAHYPLKHARIRLHHHQNVSVQSSPMQYASLWGSVSTRLQTEHKIATCIPGMKCVIVRAGCMRSKARKRSRALLHNSSLRLKSWRRSEMSSRSIFRVAMMCPCPCALDYAAVGPTHTQQ